MLIMDDLCPGCMATYAQLILLLKSCHANEGGLNPHLCLHFEEHTVKLMRDPSQ